MRNTARLTTGVAVIAALSAVSLFPLSANRLRYMAARAQETPPAVFPIPLSLPTDTSAPSDGSSPDGQQARTAEVIIDVPASSDGSSLGAQQD